MEHQKLFLEQHGVKNTADVDSFYMNETAWTYGVLAVDRCPAVRESYVLYGGCAAE